MITWEKAKLMATDLGKPKAMVYADGVKGGAVALGRVMGEISGTKLKVDGQGRSSVELMGRFKGIPATPFTVKQKDYAGNDVDILIEAIVSTRCLMPITIHNLLVKESEKDGVSIVQFAVDIDVKAASNPAGYEYHVTPLFPIDGAESDPFAGIAARIDKAVKPVDADAKAKAA
jgi:hypothetical protein